VYRRGAVWTAELPDIGRKPAVIVSPRLVTLRLHPIVARITGVDRERSLATVAALDPGEVDGLPQASFVLAHDLYTLPAKGLITHLGWLGRERMLEVDGAVLTALGIGSR
jgi:mRNA-degrading endonuclease toxin of MazEF toxin-antitoxin module